MEILLGLLLVSSLGISLYCRRQSSKIGALSQDVERRDEEIRGLNDQLREIKRGGVESRAFHATISSVAFDLVLVLDEDLIVVMYNESAERFFGNRSPIGESLQNVIGSPELHSLVQHALTEPDCLEEQFEIDGAYYRARTQVISFEGERRFVGIAMQDVTNLVNLNRARRDLVANISHELRTPITRIRLIIEGLFLDADKPKRKASIQSLKEIAMETDALLWLAQELLDLSMIESGQAIMRLVPTSLKQVVDDLIERFEPHTEMKGLKIVSQVPQKYDALCDADQLTRVLGNLIHNAIKWSPPDEVITITASEQTDEITVSVYDNGPGVPEDLRERIFERFYQADVSRSGDEGTGLGLAICKHIIEAHGGRIWAEGNGKGGQFLFTVLKPDVSNQIDSNVDTTDLTAAVSEAASPALVDN